MEQLIPIINELQDTYSKLGIPFIDLPQIVIIGSQSAGKSSVLENIVKQEFLPRGTGIVTRCPLILHLVHDTDIYKGTRGRFLHTGEYDYYDFNDIKEEIIKQTDILAGTDKNITDQPITLKIFSHEFPNLTLIDLPGLTKVAVESQPKDIDIQIKNTCLRYASKENSIILAISAANVDLANSDSLRFAEELDPEGKRTLCVITKLDLMDRGTNANDILTGKVLPKQLGYIGIVSRSQEDIIMGKPIDESLVYEKEFFQKNYPNICDKCGTGFLTSSLNALLKHHIRKCLPNLRDVIKEKINSAYCKLELLGPEIIDKRMLIPDFICNFTNSYYKFNDGNFEEDLKTIRGGALIAEILYIIYQDNIMKINIDQSLTDNVIMNTIHNTCGANKMSFAREKPFICLVREQIQKLLDPSLKCLEDVFETMRDFVYNASKEFPFNNYPNLMEKILHETHVLIKNSYGISKMMVENLIISEKADVMCNHPNFRLGYALENLNFQQFNIEENLVCNGIEINFKDSLIEKGFKNICENIEQNFQDFSNILIYYINKSKKTMPIIDLLKNKNHNREEKIALLDEIQNDIFQNNPSILDYRIQISQAMINEELKFYDDLMQFELNNHVVKLPEMSRPSSMDLECIILKHLVIDYFNMVRQNIGYYIPKLIKAFLVINVREKLMNYLQKIYSVSDLDFLLTEAEPIFKQRKVTKALLEELENVKKRIEDIYSDQI